MPGELSIRYLGGCLLDAVSGSLGGGFSFRSYRLLSSAPAFQAWPTFSPVA